mmetsp:Transcript_17120/g.46984  ORF Transcript_17120/g.46984 Transcript_17120/m.46984 type:complete len:106 (-) Transcript_17120:2632-2949(-)
MIPSTNTKPRANVTDVLCVLASLLDVNNHNRSDEKSFVGDDLFDLYERTLAGPPCDRSPTNDARPEVENREELASEGSMSYRELLGEGGMSYRELPGEGGMSYRD